MRLKWFDFEPVSCVCVSVSVCVCVCVCKKYVVSFSVLCGCVKYSFLKVLCGNTLYDSVCRCVCVCMGQREHYSSSAENKSPLFSCVIYRHIVSVSVIQFSSSQCVCTYLCVDFHECDREVDRKGSAVILSVRSLLSPPPFFFCS